MDTLVEDFRILRLDRNYYREINSSNRREISTQNYNGFEITFANHTDMTLKVKGRIGMVKTIKPKFNPASRTMYSLDGGVPGVGVKIGVSIPVSDIDENLAELEKSKLKSALSAELLYALRAEVDIYEKKSIRDFEKVQYLYVEVLFVIPEYDIGRGYKYFPELDLTIGLFHYSEETPAVPHPNTQDQLTRGTDNTTDYFHKGGHDSEALSVSVKVVEKTPNTYGDRYVHLLGETYKVPITTARGNTKEGVYVKRNFTSIGIGKETDRNETMFFTLDEAKSKFGLDVTAEGAYKGGDPKLLAELELVEKKREIEDLKIKAMEEKWEMDKEKHRMDVEERKTKAELDRRKAINDLTIKLNDQLIKSKASNRKPPDGIFGTVTNVLKGITGLITAGMGLAALA